MLNALSSYLQQLPLASHTATATTETGATKSADRLANSDFPDAYAPSARAILVSAVASDYDVRALNRQELGGLQRQLQQYGLLAGRDLDAFALINTQTNIPTDNNDAIDAVQVLDQATQSFNERNTPYSERQNISRLHRLMHNLASARQVLSASS